MLGYLVKRKSKSVIAEVYSQRSFRIGPLATIILDHCFPEKRSENANKLLFCFWVSMFAVPFNIAIQPLDRLFVQIKLNFQILGQDSFDNVNVGFYSRQGFLIDQLIFILGH